MKFLHTYYIHRISRQPITIFSSISTTSWTKNASLSWNSWSPESLGFTNQDIKVCANIGKVY